MPFKSLAQRAKFHALVAEGKMSPETLKHWEDATPKDKKLPEHVKKGSDMNFLEDLYNVGVNKYLDKIANEQAESQQPPHNPEHSVKRPWMDHAKNLHRKFRETKHKHDPYFSTALGGALGAGLGSIKGRGMGIMGGGLGSLLGLSLAKDKERFGG